MVQLCFLSLKCNKRYSKLFFRFIKLNRTTQTMEHQKILNLLNEEAILNSWQENETMINNQSN